jgi:hypothetical protein
MASKMLDLPMPLSPIKQFILGLKSNVLEVMFLY